VRPRREARLHPARQAHAESSSESLAGRIAQRELTPFLWSEVVPSGRATEESLWLRGGFADSVLADDDASSLRWREEFIRTFLERDLPQLGFRVPAPTMRRFWNMCSRRWGARSTRRTARCATTSTSSSGRT
jgi:predicted AAA+ superfamily ATPase